MNEENIPGDEMDNQEWEAPAPPEPPVADEAEEAQMSEVASLGNIFFDPGNTFKDMRRKPRFILAGIIVVLLFAIFTIGTTERIGLENAVRDRIETSSQTRDLPKEQKDRIVAQQSSSIVKGISYGAVPIGLIITFVIGGLIYWLGTNAFGGSARFPHGISVWIYSALPPTLLFVIGNMLVLFLKSPDDISPTAAQRGLLQVNPSILVDAKEMPVLAALLSSFDLFAIWGYVLAVIGLKAVGKISSSSAVIVVLIPALIGVTVKVVAALLFS